MKKNNRRSIPAPPTNIYDQFLIVGLKEETLAPTVLYTYPSQNPASPNVALFCFPEDICKETVARIKTGASFFFVLTDEVGRQQVGFTRRIGKGKDMRCLCMLTHRDSSWMYTFGSILEECEGRYKAKGNQLEPFLAALHTAPVPDPGMEIAKSVREFPNTAPPTLCHLYSRPIPCPDTTDTALFGASMIPLLANLTTTSILQLFASLLFERRTILVSSQLERVSACAQAAVSALFPFAWHHIFIPVLPLSLVDYCSAPMPFVIGLHSSLMLSIIKMPLSEVVYVDLDRDQVSAVQGDLQLLPSNLISTLKTILDTGTAEFHTVSSASKSNFDWQRVSDAFRSFFVKMFVGYSKFFISKPGLGVSFDKEGFITSQPKNNRKFLEAFCASQMFERFIAEREAGKQNALFENEIKLQEAAQAHVGIGSAIQDKAKKSVERLTTFGAAVRNNLLENPFGYHKNNQDSSSVTRPSPQPNPPASLHPSLTRGQVPAAAASAATPPRKPKPLPPIPINNTTAFPPDISNIPKSASPWDAFSDNTEALKPSGRPKSATVTAISPSGTVPIISPPPPVSMLPHSNSTNSIVFPSSVPPPNTNVFEFHPFDMDPTPATPAPSISNTHSPAWFSPELVVNKLAAVSSSNDSLNPFLTPSSPKGGLPPISMKPLNPFVDANPPTVNEPREEETGNANIFTSFSLDALAPPDIQSVHSPLSSSYSSAGFFSPSFGTSPSTSAYASKASSPSTSGAFMPPFKGGGTVPNNYVVNASFGLDSNNAQSGGTVPNYASPLDSNSNAGGTVPNYNTNFASPLDATNNGGTVPNYNNNAGTVPNYHAQSGGTVPNYNYATPVESGNVQGTSPDFDSFLAARLPTSSSAHEINLAPPMLRTSVHDLVADHVKVHARSSSDIPAAQHQQLLSARMPVRSSSASSLNPVGQQQNPSEDDFDSFLASRIKHM